MEGKTFVTKGYSPYTDIPAARLDGYDHGQVNPANQYAAERFNVPAHGFTGHVGSPTILAKPKYATTYTYEEYEPMKSNNVSSPKNHMFSNPMKSYRLEESNVILSEPALTEVNHIRIRNVSDPNNSWQSGGPPATHHPLTTSTNNINEALGFLEESMYHSHLTDPRRRGVLDDLSTRARLLEPQRRYARPAFVFKPNDTQHNFTDTKSAMDSHEATKRYGGPRVA